MVLPNLSGLRIVAQRAPGGPRDRRRALRTGSALTTTTSGSDFVFQVKKVAQPQGAQAVRAVIARVLGSQFAKRVQFWFEEGVKLEADGTTVTFKLGLDTPVMRKITMSEEFLNACIAYFAKPVLSGHMVALTDPLMARAWASEKDDAIRMFYNDFPSMDIADAGLRCMCATDAKNFKTPLVGAPPREYVQEFLCQPWYFREFMGAFELLSKMWDSGEILRKSFRELATISWEALGWAVDPHQHSGNLGGFMLSNAYQPTEEDLRLFQARFAYRDMSMVYVDGTTGYWALWNEFKKAGAEVPPMTDFGVERKKGWAWAVYIRRTWTERDALLAKLETMWDAYKKSGSLVDLVDLIQQFNGNHYFRDGNGRFSMLLIQLHMRATQKQLVYFWDHNPNGPCLAKYVHMLQTAPRIPKVLTPKRLFDREAIRNAFGDALDFHCDGFVHDWMPYLDSDMSDSDTEPVYRSLPKRARSSSDVLDREHEAQQQRTAAVFVL